MARPPTCSSVRLPFCRDPARFLVWFTGCDYYCPGHPACARHAAEDSVISREEVWPDACTQDR